ncbi:hypothetical protein BCV70DRAFT_106065 [Testicularia cyperi]|uniref:Uncharacterized protein n=1 Tax=Testicularia cyperi TaxID=1882483 RepID=A0A317XPF8_9BASI|nr:hypothetical protein BCV70DRAFT_106065 [Testicularia cyperi]
MRLTHTLTWSWAAAVVAAVLLLLYSPPVVAQDMAQYRQRYAGVRQLLALDGPGPQGQEMDDEFIAYAQTIEHTLAEASRLTTSNPVSSHSAPHLSPSQPPPIAVPTRPK